jgi:hypothetical protein
MALLQEMNKKFKFGIDNVRAELSEIGMMVLEMFAQYRPKYEYMVDGGTQYEQKTIDFPLELLRDGLTVDLAASSELLNTEVRREINLTLYQLLSDYMTKTASMVQAILSPQVPPEFKKYLINSAKVGEKLLGQIVGDFGGWEKDDLVVPLEASVNLEKAMAPPPPSPARPPMPGQQRPGGPPGPGGPMPMPQGGPQGGGTMPPPMPPMMGRG